MTAEILLPFVPPFQVGYNANALFVRSERPLQLRLLWAEEVDWAMVERFEAAMLVFTASLAGRALPPQNGGCLKIKFMLDIHERIVGSNSITWPIKRESQIMLSSAINILVNLVLYTQRMDNPVLQLCFSDADEPENLELAPIDAGQLNPFLPPPQIPFEHNIEDRVTDHVLIQVEFVEPWDQGEAALLTKHFMLLGKLIEYHGFLPALDLLDMRPIAEMEVDIYQHEMDITLHKLRTHSDAVNMLLHTLVCMHQTGNSVNQLTLEYH